MADRIRRLGGSGPARFGVRGPGGVDFSTLDLAYVGKPVKGKGLPYAFSADKVQDETGDKGWGGKAKAQLISDSFFTWLALTPDKFWVNLNPDQPDQIMDKTFGKTDAGRVLLQADLQMKHDYAKDVDYRKDPGKQYAEAMRAADIPCGDTIRLWITPKTAKVRTDDGGLYILDTPLKVNVDHIDRETPDPNGNDCKLTETQRDTANGLLKQYIIPGVEKKVNTSADYADLRRVHSARVAAEYVRQSDAEQAGDYHAVIDSGDIARWPVRSPNRSWTPKQTWDDYMKSFTKGDYSLPCEVGGQQKMCVMGGVDFGKAPRQNITRVEFKARHPNLEKTTKIATEGQTESADNPAAGPPRRRQRVRRRRRRVDTDPDAFVQAGPSAHHVADRPRQYASVDPHPVAGSLRPGRRCHASGHPALRRQRGRWPGRHRHPGAHRRRARRRAPRGRTRPALGQAPQDRPAVTGIRQRRRHVNGVPGRPGSPAGQVRHGCTTGPRA